MKNRKDAKSKYDKRIYLERCKLSKFGELGLYEKHEEIANELKEIQTTCGGINIPLSIMDVIFNYLQANDKNQNNIEAARNTAHVFACLCNEFPLMVRSYKIRDWFFMTDDKWKIKYKIGDRTRTRSIELLKEMGWIDYLVKVIRRKPIFRVTLFQINLEAIQALKPQVRNFRSESWESRWSEYISEQMTRPENNLTRSELMQKIFNREFDNNGKLIFKDT